MKRTLLIFTSLMLLSFWIAGYAEEVMDRQIDKELKEIWNGMVDRLIRRDIEGAAGYITSSTRERYREQFHMIEDRLPEIFRVMRDIEPVYIKKDEAKYRIRIREDGGERTDYIWFRKDLLGRWKIERF